MSREYYCVQLRSCEIRKMKYIHYVDQLFCLIQGNHWFDVYATVWIIFRYNMHASNCILMCHLRMSHSAESSMREKYPMGCNCQNLNLIGGKPSKSDGKSFKCNNNFGVSIMWQLTCSVCSNDALYCVPRNLNAFRKETIPVKRNEIHWVYAETDRANLHSLS